MPLLSFQDITKFYGRQDVLKQANFHVNPGERLGLVGPNGAGKTTILRLILGQENPDSGHIHQAKGLRIGYLPQDLMTFSGRSLLDLVMDTAEEIRAVSAELEFINLDIETAAGLDPPDEAALLELTARQGRLMTLFENLGGYSLEANAGKILTGLGFAETDFHRPIEEFSGGWIMRAVLARLLLASPDILLLDEPTNHLDLDSLLWLEKYLQTCPSALLLVSHDRVFLNNVVQRIVEVNRGQTVSYAGNYDQYLAEKDKRQVAEAAAYASQQGRIKQIERFIERNKVRAATARRAQSRMKMLEKMDKLEAPGSSEPQTFRLSLPQPSRGPDNLVELSGVAKSYGTNQVYKDLDLTIRRGDRIAFLGPNGRGKSTLLKLLAGVTGYQAGTRRIGTGVIISYFAQFQLEELDANRTVLDELGSVAGDLTPGRLRSILGGFLFKGDDVFKKVAVLSGGEKSRLLLAKMMIVAPNLLLLDEPTNHLDIPGREMLETAIKEYTGTLCLISHDRHLINAMANHVLVIQSGRVQLFPGNFDDYQNLWQDRLETTDQPRHESPVLVDKVPTAKGLTRAEREAKKRADAQTRQRLHALRAPLVQEMERLEAEQHRLSERLDTVTSTMALPETYLDAQLAKNLTQEYGQLKAQINTINISWESKALELEELEAKLTRSDDDF